jgi:type II secretory pathway component PulF
MPQKSSLKSYLIVVSIVTLTIVLGVNFGVLPALEEILTKIDPNQIEAIKKRLFYITIGLLIFILLVNFYFWKLESQWEKEEREIELNIKINPSDQVLKENLEKIRNKRKQYIMLIEPISIIILGAVIGFIVVSILSILKPLYGSLGTF